MHTYTHMMRDEMDLSFGGWVTLTGRSWEEGENPRDFCVEFGNDECNTPFKYQGNE